MTAEMGAHMAERAGGIRELRFRIRHLDETPSTNLLIKQAIAAGEPEGLAVHADVQTGGYGRQGRTWASPKGGLYASFLLRPDVPASQLTTLPLAASVAVLRALRGLVPEDARDRISVKWPNDVLLDGGLPGKARKLCGISCEAIDGAVCLGIGVNVAAQAIPPEAAHQAAALQELASDATVASALDALLRELTEVYGRWCVDRLGSFIGEYRIAHVLTGREVVVVDMAGNQFAAGTVQSVDEYGRLELCSAGGATERVSSGEAHIIW